MSRKYLASLALAAVLVLAGGILLRERLLRAQPAAPAPPSEGSALQQLSQDRQIQRLSDFLSNRVTAVTPNVAYIATANATGVPLGSNDSLVTTLPDRPVVAMRLMTGDTVRVPIVADAAATQRDWVLIVGRASDGGVVSSAGILGGRSVGRCGDDQVTQYVLNVALHDGFAGAGVFDLGGRLIGMIARCDNRYAALPASEIRRMLTAAATLAARLWDGYGFAVAPLDDRMRAYFNSDSGVLVIASRRTSRSNTATLRPGDLVLAVDGRQVATPDDLGVLVGAPSRSHTVVRRRGGVLLNIQLGEATAFNGSLVDSSPSSHVGIQLDQRAPTSGVPVGNVRPGFPAAAAGLRSGDRLVEIDGRAVANVAAVQRVLERSRREASTFVVFERDSVQRGVLIPR